MAQEDREAYIAWLRDEVGWHGQQPWVLRGLLGLRRFRDPRPDGRGLRELNAGGGLPQARRTTSMQSISARETALSGPWRTS